MVIFVDDLNMPQVEEYGAQPPIELLRQYMDYSGWYDRKELTFRKLVDVQFIAAMGPPGGGRNHVTNRYLRHYSLVCATPFDEATLSKIFTTLVEWWARTRADPRARGETLRRARVRHHRSVLHGAARTAPDADEVALHVQPARRQQGDPGRVQHHRGVG